MQSARQESVREHVGTLRRQFLQNGDLPFTDILTEERVAPALAAVTGWLDRIYSPLVTLWVFLGQVLTADHSCRAAVARLIAHRLARGQDPCSAETGAYCQARQRLPETFFSAVACAVGRALDAKAEPGWRWKGRRVYLFDGTTVTMPDTPENQAAYPQVYNQGRGLGFPIARVGAVISLACGAVVNLGFCRCAGGGDAEAGDRVGPTCSRGSRWRANDPKRDRDPTRGLNRPQKVAYFNGLMGIPAMCTPPSGGRCRGRGRDGHRRRERNTGDGGR